MPIDPRRLAVLRAVADAGGVVAAAPALHMTPSAVSQQIARLEAETGAVLLDRSQLGGRRAARLTSTGLMLAEHARRVGDVLDTAERDLALVLGRLHGAVRVGGFPSAIPALIAPVAAAIHTRYPEVSVQIRQVEAGPGVAALRTRELDLLVAESDPGGGNPAGIRAHALFDDPFVIVCPAQWGVRGPDLAALRARPWVQGPVGSAAREALDRLASELGAPLRRDHECLEPPVALGMVAAGLAAAVLPRLALSGQIFAGEGRVAVIRTPVVGVRHVELRQRAGGPAPSPLVRLVGDEIVVAAHSASF
jgi:DNA-binding transcriptional LysR family regulator